MRKDLVIVIHEHDFEDGEDDVIGVAYSVQDAEEMIKEYYGEDNLTEESYTDIRDSNLEYSKVFKIRQTLEGQEDYKVRITLEWFNVNKI